MHNSANLINLYIHFQRIIMFSNPPIYSYNFL